MLQVFSSFCRLLHSLSHRSTLGWHFLIKDGGLNLLTASMLLKLKDLTV